MISHLIFFPDFKLNRYLLNIVMEGTVSQICYVGPSFDVCQK